MLTESEAIERILSAVHPLPPQSVPLRETFNRFAAHPLLAMVPLPGFNNSAMDGYAVQAADSKNTLPLRVTGEQPAGSQRDLKVGPGEAVRIFTGAPIPIGANAVIMQEDVTKIEGGTQITCNEPVELNENVRLLGCDICVGQRILEIGQRITAARIGMLAAQGLSAFEVTTKPRVAVVTTGDELAVAGKLLQPGQIYNSNGVMLQAMLGGLGIDDVTVQHAADDYLQTADTLRGLIASHDFLIICGGVSVGDHDCVRPALQALRVKPGFWRVKIKPGKPLLFTQAPRADGSQCTIFGLPGNPVSAFVTFELFVRPALLKAMGASAQELKHREVRAVLDSKLTNGSNRPHYVRGSFDGQKFIPQGGQRSNELLALGNSNALLRMEPDSELAAGTDVTAILM
ncbi:MAG: molybdopterin molybdotransferase MoeA [Verrucomicrobia bacterium]|nr:molybdopterin molybdotransferase MoeA [Verrucomicrobiota bacterium]